MTGTKSAQLLVVKVIVQDRESKYFLATDGCWVANEMDARDFFSLLPAYYFARNFTSRAFKVMLYCADDGYRAVIIEGEGNGADLRSAAGGDPTWERFNACVRAMPVELN